MVEIFIARSCLAQAEDSVVLEVSRSGILVTGSTKANATKSMAGICGSSLRDGKQPDGQTAHWVLTRSNKRSSPEDDSGRPAHAASRLGFRTLTSVNSRSGRLNGASRREPLPPSGA